MTDIDPHADIQITRHQDHVTAKIPLAGQLTPGSAGHYQKLARDLPIHIEEHPGQAWIRVQVPANADPDDVLVILDSARGLLGQAEEAAQQEGTPAEATIREWWARQRRGSPR
jgi:hypothetical protein